MAHLNITLETELLHELFVSNGKNEAFSKLLETIFNQVLLKQSSEQLGAAPYERDGLNKLRYAIDKQNKLTRYSYDGIVSGFC